MRVIYLTFGRKNLNGRNNFGRITTFHRGGGLKRKFRNLDFKRDFYFFVPAIVKKIYKDFYRTGFVALILYYNGVLSYILSPEFVYPGFLINYSTYESFFFNDLGSVHILKDIPFNINIYNLEMYALYGGQISRAAGTSSIIIRNLNTKYLVIQLPSGQHKAILNMCKATIGIVSNKEHLNFNYKKAGFKRNFNRRPIVRGVAMNAVDHPHGGGRGKTSGGPYLRTPWGLNTKFRKTRINKRTNFTIINIKE